MTEDAPPDPEIEGYTVLSVLGRGLSGTVYLARQEALGRKVALKVLGTGLGEAAALDQRFLLEARVLAEVQHPALVPLFDAAPEAEPPYLASAFMEGGDLTSWQGRAPPDGAEVARIGARIAEALAALHAADILHRDVKPANVMLDEQGRAYLGDMGLVRLEAGPKLTQTGGLVGTLRFLAPELLEGEGYSPASDLYALGLTLADLALDQRPEMPFQPPPFTDAALSAIEPPALQAVIHSCLRPLPEDRPQEAAEVARLLGEIAEGRVPRLAPATPEARPPAPSPLDAAALPRPERQRSTPWGLVAGATVVLGLVAGFLGSPPAPGPGPPTASAGPPAATPTPPLAPRRPGVAQVGLPTWKPDRLCAATLLAPPEAGPRKQHEEGLELVHAQGLARSFGKKSRASAWLELRWPDCPGQGDDRLVLALEVTRLPPDSGIRVRGDRLEVVLDHPDPDRPQELRGVWLSVELDPAWVPGPDVPLRLEVVPLGPARWLTARVKAALVLRKG